MPPSETFRYYFDSKLDSNIDINNEIKNCHNDFYQKVTFIACCEKSFT